jgi:hypothetical protein
VSNKEFQVRHGLNVASGYANVVNPTLFVAGQNVIASFDAANNYAGAMANAANSYADSLTPDLSPAFNKANASYTVANAAFDKANSALQNTSGTFAGNLTITGAANATSFYANTYIDFDQLPYNSALTPYKKGRLWYNSDAAGLQLDSETVDFPLSMGEREWVRCRNSSGSTILKGQPVYVTGVHMAGHPIHGHHPTIALADASDVTKKEVIGLAGHDIADGTHGYVVCRGWIANVNTSMLTTGTRIHLGWAAPGTLVNAAPEYPNYPMDVGTCLTSDATVGTLYVDIFDHSVESFRIEGPARVGGDFTVEGDFTVLGTQTITNIDSLSLGTQYIYLSAGDSIPNSNITFTGTGLNDMTFRGHYEGAGTTAFWVKITEANVNGDYFSWSYDNFSTVEASNTKILYETAQPLSNGISVYFQANTGHTIGAKWNASTTAVSSDFGFIGNHVDGGSYTHSGMFRDATDGTFRFFNRYDAEPNGNIDISNTTFKLANVQVQRITAAEYYSGSVDMAELVTRASGVANAGYTVANAAFDKANSANVLAYNTGIGANNYAGTMANAAGVIANAAFGHSNTTYTAVNSAFGVINAAFGVANNAYTSTNGAAAFGFANGVATNAAAAFGHSNITYTAVNSAFGVVNAAFGVANTALQNTTGVFAGSLRVTGDVILGSGRTPGANVEIVSTSGVTIRANNAAAAVNSRVWDHAVTTGEWQWYTKSDDNTQSSAIMRVARSGVLVQSITFPEVGNVGIGMVSPTYKLDVNGTINAANIVINGFSPFIAANNYAGDMANAANAYAGTVGTSTNNYTSATYSTLTQFGSAFAVTNAAFGVANNAYTSTNGAAAFGFANGVATNAAAAFGSANTVGTSANTAGSYANTAGLNANQAGVVANTKLSNTSGVSFAGNLYFPSGCVAIGIASTNYPLTIASGAVTPLTGLSGAITVAEGSTNGYNQFNIRNGSNGSGASSDYIATADDGSDTTNFLDLGINNSNYNAPSSWTINGARDGYLYMADGNLSIGVANATSTSKFVNFFVGGSLAADEVMRIQDSAGGANVGIGRTNPGYKLDVVGTINCSTILVNGAAVSGGGLGNTDNVVTIGSLQVNNNLFVANNIYTSNNIITESVIASNNVSIGRPSTTAYALDIVGTVNASAVMVNGVQVTSGSGLALGLATATMLGFNLP